MTSTIRQEQSENLAVSRQGTVVSPVAPPTDSVRSNLGGLTGLRFFAAMHVVLYHFARVPMPGWAFPVKNFIASGYTAVGLFFTLSGFIISYTYLDGQRLRGKPKQFWISRFARIYPAYLLAFLIAAPTDIQLSLHANHLGSALAKLTVNAIAVLTMQQAWTPWTAWAWNYPAWSVSVEIFFYLLFPWLGPVLARVPKGRRLQLGLVLWVASLCAPFLLFIFKGTTGPPELGDHLQMFVEFTPLFRLPEFAIGILVGLAYKDGAFGWKASPWVSSVLAVLLLSVLAFLPQIPHPLLAGGLLTPLFAALIVSIAVSEGGLSRWLSLPFLVLLGEASYGIYILQIPVSFLTRTPPPIEKSVPLLLYCVALVGFALLSFRWVESPLRKRIRTRLGVKGSSAC